MFVEDGVVIARPRTPDDLAACVSALRAVHRSDGYPTYWPDDPPAWLTPQGTSAAWVAEVDGAVAAHVVVVTGVHPWDAAPAAAATGVPEERLSTVSRLFTSPAARGRGAGRAVLAAAVEHARSGGRQLVLDVVDDGGPAVALYEGTGWRLLHERQADWATPEGVHLPVRVYAAP